MQTLSSIMFYQWMTQLQVKKILFITQRSFPLGYQFLNTGQEKSMLWENSEHINVSDQFYCTDQKMFLLIVQFDVIGLLIFLKVQEMPNRKVHIFHFKIKSQIHLVHVSQLFSMQWYQCEKGIMQSQIKFIQFFMTIHLQQILRYNIVNHM